MDGEKIKQSLEGLSQLDHLMDILFALIYWVGFLFVIFLIAYIVATINCNSNKRRKGSKNDDEFLDD